MIGHTSPILFTDENVQLIMKGLKTETRRLSKSWLVRKKGDVLWVKESVYVDAHGRKLYRADFQNPSLMVRVPGTKDKFESKKWPNKLYMRKADARLFLELVEDPRTECLHEIDPSGAVAEGCQGGPMESPLEQYKEMWSKINKHRGDRWDDNPAVVVLKFKRI